MVLIKDEISPHFKLSEFACGDKLYLSAEFVRFVLFVIEPFRVWYGREININSGYRSFLNNKAVNGDADSLHLTAMAIDFNLPSEWRNYTYTRQAEFLRNIKAKWFELCRKAGGYGQITVHDGWLHLGMSEYREYYDDRRSLRGV